VRFVVDASVATKWFVEEEGREEARRLLETAELLAPDLVFAEVANTLWKKLKRQEVSFEHARDACALLPSIFVEVVPTRVTLVEALAIARALDHPVYDCIYVACAKRLGLSVVTADSRLIAKVEHHSFRASVASMSEANDLIWLHNGSSD